MKHLVDLIGVGLFGVSWVAGMVLAEGFWLTILAIILPPYAWYLVVERALEAIGW